MRLNRPFPGILLALIFVSGAARAAEMPEAGGDPDVTLITLHEKNILPEDLFNLIGKQAGLRFSANGTMWEQARLQKPVDAEYKDQPFWLVVSDLCDKLGIQTSRYGSWSGGGPNRIYLENATALKSRTDGPVCMSGGCRITALSLSRQLEIPFAEPEKRRESATLILMVALDPKIRVSTFYSNLVVEEAVDDAGNDLMSPENYRDSYSNDTRIMRQMNVYLKYPAKPGTKIVRLKGSLRLRVAQATEAFTVDSPMQAAESAKTIGDTTITFRSLKKLPNGNYELKLSASGGEPVAGLKSHLIFSSSRLMDASGKTFQQGGASSSGGDFTLEYAKGYSDGATGEPVKWSIELPTQVRMLKIPVEFKDLPLQ